MAFLYNPPLSVLMDFFLKDGQHQGFSDVEIQEAEARLGVALPPVYRDFLRTYGRDSINYHFNQLQEPAELSLSYLLIEDELKEREQDFRDTVRGEAPDSSDPYFKLWQMSRERWGEETDCYLLIWYENQGVWSAGYRVQDLLDGNPDPPVYGSVNDDYVTYVKWADHTEEFLLEMLREAAYGWRGGQRFTKESEIQEVLSAAGIDRKEMEAHGHLQGNISFCLSEDGETLYCCLAGQKYQELSTANRHPVPRASAAPQLLPQCPSYTPDYRKAWRLALLPNQARDLGMGRPRPAGGIPLHPLVARLMEEQFGRIPPTAYDWGKDIARLKTLKVQLHMRTALEYRDGAAYLCPPGEYPPPPPYYYDLGDWSIIGRMTALQSLLIEGVEVEDPALWPLLAKLPNLKQLRIQDLRVGDFSFLPACKALRSVSFYHTDFSDCRLLLDLPELQDADLRFCPLEHKEALKALSFRPLI